MTQELRKSRIEALKLGILGGSRRSLAQAITLVESRHPSDQSLAEELLNQLLPQTGGSLRLGVSGVPGSGKSTLIDRLGSYAIKKGRRVAVLAVDPSSHRSGGSILGDKTRMPALAAQKDSFIRPSPSGGTLGGIARRTREALLLCEAAGYDLTIVETVGVGQSEHTVSEMVDTFLLLFLSGAGDEVQSIKRGVIEFSHLLAVNKADGENRAACERVAHQLRNALQLFRSVPGAWQPQVLTLSALEGKGVAELWAQIDAHRVYLDQGGELHRKRRAQQRAWLWALLEEGFRERLRSASAIAERLPELEGAVEQGTVSPPRAARELLAAMFGDQ